MARVWAARIHGTTDILALKVLLPDVASNVEFRKMFLDEARIACRVRHPNVCTTFQMGEQDGVLFLAMEWIDGPSLVRVLQPTDEASEACVPLLPRIAARIIADACAGLHAAHELVDDDGRKLGVVHRDVSPHNLLMTSEGRVKVADFGVAKALGKSHRTITGQLKGKLAYMAPEQLVGGPVDRRCDVFALGCVLYEITTGRRPFQGEHDPQVMTSIVLGRFDPPGVVVPGFPPELGTVIGCALANDVNYRYPTAEHMRLALEAYLQHSGPSLGEPQIQALIRERLGDELNRRANVPSEKRRVSPAPPRHSFVPRGQTMQQVPDSQNASARVSDRPRNRGLLWMIAAPALGAVLGIAVLALVRSDRVAPKARTTVSVGTMHDARVQPFAKPVLPDTARRVHLRIVPEGAVIIVDGVVLPRGTNVVEKPRAGQTMNVLVRAAMHEDAVFTIDATTAEHLDVTLASNEIEILPTPAVSTSAASDVVPRGTEAGVLPSTIEPPPNPYE
jgi:serine/threonine-protein kinase